MQAVLDAKLFGQFPNRMQRADGVVLPGLACGEDFRAQMNLHILCLRLDAGDVSARTAEREGRRRKGMEGRAVRRRGC
jgi:hypothetical protein